MATFKYISSSKCCICVFFPLFQLYQAHQFLLIPLSVLCSPWNFCICCEVFTVVFCLYGDLWIFTFSCSCNSQFPLGQQALSPLPPSVAPVGQNSFQPSYIRSIFFLPVTSAPTRTRFSHPKDGGNMLL